MTVPHNKYVFIKMYSYLAPVMDGNGSIVVTIRLYEAMPFIFPPRRSMHAGCGTCWCAKPLCYRSASFWFAIMHVKAKMTEKKSTPQSRYKLEPGPYNCFIRWVLILSRNCIGESNWSCHPLHRLKKHSQNTGLLDKIRDPREKVPCCSGPHPSCCFPRISTFEQH